MKKLLGVLILGLLALSLQLVIAYPGTDVFVSPPHTDVNEGSNFVVTVNASSLNIFTVVFDLYFNSSVLEALSVEEGDFLNEEGNTNSTYCFMTEHFPDIFEGKKCYTINNTIGEITFQNTRISNTSVSGSGSLAEITFRAKSGSTSDLDLQNVEALRVIDYQIEDITDLSVTDGDVYVNPLRTVDISLTQGWNVFSLSVEPEDTSIGSVLASISGSYDIVWTTINGVPYSNTGRFPIIEIMPERSYLILMNTADILTVQGFEPKSKAVQFASGWNLLGYPSMSNRLITDVLSGIDYDIVWTTVNGIPYSDKGRFPITDMVTGNGYLVRMNLVGSYDIVNR